MVTPATNSQAPLVASTGLLTDRYELTMLGAALRDGTAQRHCSFEVFARRLPEGRRYGVVAGTARLLEAIAAFRFDADTIEWLLRAGIVDDGAAEYLSDYQFRGDITGYAEGELYFPYSPLLSVSGTFAEAVVLETLVLSILNHDSAIASAASRMVTAAQGRQIIEMGSRRTHEYAAVSAARAAYLAGFAATSNLQAQREFGVPSAGTAAHAFTLLHDDEQAAFRAQVDALGTGTTLLVDTYDITRGIASAVEAAGPTLGSIRIDSGDLGVLAQHARAQLDGLGARSTRIIVSGDLDEYSIAALAIAPVDAYGAGTAVVTGSGAPTAGLVYKLVEVDGRPVAKRSEHKASHGGEKRAYRLHKPSGTAIEELVVTDLDWSPPEHARSLQRPLIRAGKPVEQVSVEQSREHLRAVLVTLPLGRVEALAWGTGNPDPPRPARVTSKS